MRVGVVSAFVMITIVGCGKPAPPPGTGVLSEMYAAGSALSASLQLGTEGSALAPFVADALVAGRKGEDWLSNEDRTLARAYMSAVDKAVNAVLAQAGAKAFESDNNRPDTAREFQIKQLEAESAARRELNEVLPKIAAVLLGRGEPAP